MDIRAAVAEDLSLLEELAREFYSSSNVIRGFSIERFCDFWTKTIDSGIGVIFLLIHDNIAVGGIGGFCYPDIYSGENIATEFFWYVSPKHRGHGLDLYYEFEKWAIGKKATQIRMGHLCDLMPEGLKIVYGELGMKPIEIHYAKDLICIH